MKKYSFLILSPFFIVLSFANAKAQPSKNKSSNSSSISVLNGAWQTTLRGSSINVLRKAYTVMHDGFYSSVSQDSTGAWRETHAGTYEISSDIFKEKVLFSSLPDHMGVTHWIDFKINGDTLYLNFFRKLIGPKGEDIAAPMPRFVQKYVRAKKSSM